MNAEVSIIIPTYNESENIKGILHSIKEHMPKNTIVEAIVVDDNSPDGTGKIPEDYFESLKEKTSPMADVDCIRIAHERGLGTGDVREIEVVGEDVSEVNFHFRVRYHLASRVGRLLWFTPFARIQSLFFRTPLVHAFIWASSVYHDRYWWPVHGKRRMADIASTPWGRLFAAYD